MLSPIYWFTFSYFLDGSDEVCEVREKCPDQAFQCSTPDPQATSTSRPMPSSNITLISDSTILSSLAAEFEAMRARKMPIKCISRAKLCDGVVDCTGKVAIFVYFYLYFLPAWLLYTIPTHPVASWVKTTLNLRPTLLVLIFPSKSLFF